MMRTGTYKKPLDGWCRVCETYQNRIPYFDLDLNGPICGECLQAVAVAELALKANEICEPSPKLIVDNP